MKFSVTMLAVCAGLAAAAPPVEPKQPHALTTRAKLSVRLMTWNIRMAASGGEKEKNEKDWSERHKRVKQLIDREFLDHEEALVCLQEVEPVQLEDLKGDWGSRSFKLIGKGRDGDQKGEHTPILYSTKVWDLKKEETTWLRPKDTGSSGKGWDASYPRIFTTGVFEHKKTKEKVVYMCTQLDSEGSEARRESAKQLADRAKQLHGEQKAPVFLAGDFNDVPGSDAYKKLSTSMVDIKSKAKRPLNWAETYTAFTETKKDDQQLDYIFFKGTKVPEIQTFWVAHNYVDGFWLSDHRAVLVDLTIN